MKAPRIVAEIGANHRGQFAIAKRMCEIALTYCCEHFEIQGHTDPSRMIVKFQKRSDFSEYPETPHPYPHQAYGPTYREHRRVLELPITDHAVLKAYIESLGGTYSCSVWDMVAAKEVVGLRPDIVKVPSARNMRWDILGYLCEKHEGEIHVSCGMVTRDEIHKIVEFLFEHDRHHDTILYHCTSGYPISPGEVCLGELEWLKRTFEGTVKGFGYSGHHLGLAIDMAAVALGIDYLERHYTLDRTWKGTDHAASLEPDGIRRLLRDSQGVVDALEEKDGILPVEVPQREKLTGV